MQIKNKINRQNQIAKRDKKPRISPKDALKVVKEAMTVIVDACTGENSNPKESYQKKYAKVHAVNDAVLDTLLHKAGVMFEKECKTREYDSTIAAYEDAYFLGSDIKKWHEKSNFAFSDKPLRPERWMFRFGWIPRK